LHKDLRFIIIILNFNIKKFFLKIQSSSSSSGDEQQQRLIPYGAPFNLIPQVTNQVTPTLQQHQQHNLFASHFNQAYLGGVRGFFFF
jgi:hypothetical protein